MHAPVAVLILSLLAGWSSSGPTGGPVNAVVVAPSDPAIVWAGNAAGVFRSTDGGATWIDSTDGLGAIRPTALLIDPHNPDTLYIELGYVRLHAPPPNRRGADVIQRTGA
jgi:hypothetical protein